MTDKPAAPDPDSDFAGDDDERDNQQLEPTLAKPITIALMAMLLFLFAASIFVTVTFIMGLYHQTRDMERFRDGEESSVADQPGAATAARLSPPDTRHLGRSA